MGEGELTTSHPAARAAGRAAALTAVAAVCAAFAAALSCRRSEPALPNVLVIVMDTTRADRCSVAEPAWQGAPTTPALDRLAATGVRYTDAWSPGGWTAPAHASLFTGLRPDRHGVDVGRRMFLDASVPTMAAELGAAGWRTACFTNNELVGADLGLARGFERWDGLFLDSARPYPWCDATHAKALEWALGVHRAGGRFFAFVNDMEPHLPYTPPDDVARRFLPADATPAEVAEARAFDFPKTLPYLLGTKTLTARERTVLTALYDAEIATLDASIGALLDALGREGVLDDTLVVVCGDHGENLGDHGLVEHRFSLHRSIRRVPLVVRLPGAFDGGRVVPEVVGLEDVFPTVLEACRIAVPRGLDGVSLRAPAAARDAFGSQGPPGEFLDRMRALVPGCDPSRFAAPLRSVFDGRFHFVRDDAGREELYDVTADPAERTDLVPSLPPELARMRTKLDAGR